jgi:hypothetical protein
MKIRNGRSQPKTDGLSIHAKYERRAGQQCRIDIHFPEADLVWRSVKIRAAAIATSKVARPLKVLVTGFNLVGSRTVLRRLELPAHLPRPYRKVHKRIDWRVCGEQDPQPVE